MAERGIFAFDSDSCGGPYRLIAAPHIPIRLEDLPASVGEVARIIVLDAVAFRTSGELTEADIRGVSGRESEPG